MRFLGPQGISWGGSWDPWQEGPRGSALECWLFPSCVSAPPDPQGGAQGLILPQTETVPSRGPTAVLSAEHLNGHLAQPRVTHGQALLLGSTPPPSRAPVPSISGGVCLSRCFLLLEAPLATPPRRVLLPQQLRLACGLLVSWFSPLCVPATPADCSDSPPPLVWTLWAERVLAESREDKPVCLLFRGPVITEL